MVNKRKFLAVTLIMIVILILFQLMGISESIILKDGENISVAGVSSNEIEAEKTLQYEKNVEKLTSEKGVADVGLVGDEESCLKVGKEWCVNQKKTYRSYPSLREAAADLDCPQILLTDGSALEEEDSVEVLTKLGQQKRSVILSGLPDANILKENPELLKCLGIRELRSEAVKLDGFKVFAGLLLGGETSYEEYEQVVPDVKLEGSVQVYAVGQSDAEWFQKLENEEYPAIIWRNHNIDGNIYVVNGEFLEEKTGAGILTGFAADLEEIYIYPIVNAQISAVANYPLLADENGAVLDKEYGQDATAITKDILWSGIAGIHYDTDEKMTALIAPRLDYEEKGKLDETLPEYFYKQVTKMQGELGVSGEQISQIPLEEKLGEDFEILNESLPNYEMRVFYAGDMEPDEYQGLLKDGEKLENIHTVLKDYSDEAEASLFSFTEGNTLEMMLYMESREHSNEDDFRLRGMQTAYGYYGTKMDMADVIYPESEEDLWNEASKDWAKYYRPYRIVYQYFDKLTATEADQRVRNYLALDYEVKRRDNALELDVKSEEDNYYFIMRTHGEAIEEIEGAEYQELEKDWYLIQTKSPEVTIKMEQTNQADYK